MHPRHDRTNRPRALWIAPVVTLLLAGGLAVLLLRGSLVTREGGGEAAAGRPNLLLITIDTLRADRLGCYGRAAARTPVIDRLAAGGVLFEQAGAPAPTTLPSHVSILTGTYPAFHGVRNNGTYRLGPGALTLAEVLAAHGYRTGAVIGSYPLIARYGLAQGFDHYDDRLPPERARQIGYRERRAQEVTRAGAAWLEQQSGGRFFLWLHYFDPHAPYDPPPPFAEQFAESPYDGEVAYVDQEVGDVLRRLDGLGLSDDTLVAVVADHGEGLGEHDEATHGVFLYESTLRVPMILSLPGVVPAGVRVARPVRTIDLMPTLLEVLGLPVPADVQGTSLMPFVTSGEAAPGREALSETVVPRENYGWSELAAIRAGRWKYILAPRQELYDLVVDPGETTNLATDRAAEARRLRDDLDRALSRATRTGEPIGERQDLDEEARERLRSLGYIWTSGSDAGASRPDPKDRIALLRTLDEARTLYARGEFAAAIRQCDAILDADPGNLTALRQRGNARVAAGDHRGAAADFEAVLAVRPRSAEVLQNLGSALLGQNELDRAVEVFRRVLDLDPDSPKAVTGLGIVLTRQGRHAEAAEKFRQALALDPSSDDARQRLAMAQAAAGEQPESEAAYRRALAADPGDSRAAVGLARILYREGRFDDVIALMERTLNAGADTPEVRFALASAHFRKGDTARAAREYDRVLAARPDDPGALFGSALVALKQGRTADAMGLLERARAADPSNAEVHRNLAILNDEAGHDREAIEGYRATLALDPEALEIHFHLARVYARSGRLDEARSEYRACLAGGEGPVADAARRELEKLDRAPADPG